MKAILKELINGCEVGASMDDCIPIWEMAWPFLYLWVKDGREHVCGKPTSLENGWTFESCDKRSGDEGQSIWIGWYYIAFTHVICFVTSWCVLHQEFQGGIPRILRFLNIEAWEPRTRISQVGWLEDWIELSPRKIIKDWFKLSHMAIGQECYGQRNNTFRGMETREDVVHIG